MNTNDNVRVLQTGTGHLTTIPARELAPGMTRGRVVGIEGEVWVDARELVQGDVYHHPPFPDNVRETTFRRLKDTFHDVYPMTLEEWEDGFRRDLHPEQEIRIWAWMADAFEHFTAGRALSFDQRKDTFNVILAAINAGKDYAHLVVNPVTLSKSRVREIVAFLYHPPV